MAGERRSRIEEIANAVTLGKAIDWEHEIASSPEALRPALLRLRQLQALNQAFRSIDAEVDHDSAKSTADTRRANRELREPILYRWGHLDVRKLIGQGSFGDVYLAADTRLGRLVALKLWRTEAAASGSSARRFLEEARRLARVCHPNVVIVHGAAVHRGQPGYWTELIRGETLESRLTRDGRLSTEEAIRIGLDVSSALGAVHAAGFVHGDVKTDNVMRCEDGRTVLMDFGAASRTASHERPFLTPLYAAPESLEGAAPHPTADIYALGTLLFRLATGDYPTNANDFEELRAARREGKRASLAALRDDLPVSFVSTVERALSDDPSQRFQSASELEGSLRRALRIAYPLRGEVPQTPSIPFTIEQLMAARIASLQTEEDRELLEVACCAGARFDPLLVAKAANLEPLQALRRLAHIEAKYRLVRSKGSEYFFDPHQIQELLYARVAEPLRRHYHSALAEALRSAIAPPAGAGSSRDAAICDHEIRGNEPARALPYLDARLDDLESRHANEAAIDLMERALVLPELRGHARSSLLTRRGRLLSLMGRRAESFSEYQKALQSIEPGEHPLLAAEIEASIGILQHLEGRSDEAVSTLQRSVEHARAAGSATSEGTSRRSLGTVLFHQGRKEEAEHEFREAMVLSRSAGAVLDVSVAAGFLGELLSEGGRFEEAERLTREAVAEARAHGSIAAELSPLATLGVLTMNRGRASEAMDAFRRLHEQSRRIGNRSGESLAWTNLGSLFLALGRYDEARETLDQVVRLAPEIQARDHEASARGDLGCLHGIRGDFERSNAAFEAADALRAEYGLAWFHGSLLLHRGGIEELYGHIDAAETFLQEALVVCTESGDPVGRSTAHLYLGRIAHEDGGARRLSHLREAKRIADEVGATPESLSASIELVLMGEVELEEALARFEEAGTRLSFVERMRALFLLFQAGGDPSHRQAADRMLSEILAGLSDDARRNAIDSIPLYRSIREARIVA